MFNTNNLFENDGRPRILFVISHLEFGGAERSLLGLVSHLDLTKYNVVVAVSQSFFRYPATLGVIKAHGIKFVEIGDKRVGSKVLRGLKLIKYVMRIFLFIRRVKPDIVHVFNPVFEQAVVRCIAKLAGAAKVVYTPTIELNFEKWHDNKWSISKKIKDYYIKLLLIYLAGNPPKIIANYFKTDMIIVYSEKEKRERLKHRYTTGNNIAVIPNGIELHRFNISEADALRIPAIDQNREIPIIGTVGRLDPQKGHKFFIRAAVKILLEIPEVHFVLIGEGTERQNLSEQIDILNTSVGMETTELREKIHFLGFKPYEDIPRFMRNFDVFVSSSIHEGRPRVLMEALALGIPVVSTDVGDVSSLIKNNENGFLIAVGNPMESPEKIAQAVIQLLRDKDLARKFSRNAKLRAKEYDIKKIVSMHETLYDSLLGNNRSSQQFY